MELDIYVPSKNAAVEVNGVFWHSEAAGRDQNYHRDKSRRARAAGVRLLTVWEDDWHRRPDAIRNLVAAHLRATTDPSSSPPFSVLPVDVARVAQYAARVSLIDPDPSDRCVVLVSGDARAAAYASWRLDGCDLIIRSHGSTAGAVASGLDWFFDWACESVGSWARMVFSLDMSLQSVDEYLAHGWVVHAEVPPKARVVDRNARGSIAYEVVPRLGVNVAWDSGQAAMHRARRGRLESPLTYPAATREKYMKPLAQFGRKTATLADAVTWLEGRRPA